MNLATPGKMVSCVVAILTCAVVQTVDAEAAESAAGKVTSVAKTPLFDIPRLNDVTIDGRGADWNGRGFRVGALTPTTDTFPLASDASASLQLAWDARGLLVFVQVRDDVAREEKSDNFWDKDSLEVFIASALGGSDSYQIVISPGIDAFHTNLRTRIIDNRKNTTLITQALSTQVARWQNEEGYTLEALLPWKNLGIAPAAGREIAFQIVLNDSDGAEARTRLFWFPEPGALSDTTKMHRLRLAGSASPAVQVAAAARYERFRRAVVDVVADEELNARRVLVREGNRGLATGQLLAQDGQARARVLLPMPPRGKGYGALSVLVGNRLVRTLQLPDIEEARRAALRDAPLRFSPFVFANETFPRVDFEQPSFVEDAVGPYTLKTTFYDRQFNVVQTAQTAGRYGAVVEIKTEDGKVSKRYVTLFRQPAPLNFNKHDAPFSARFPEELGIAGEVMTEQPEMVSQELRDIFVGSFSTQPGSAVLLAGLSELQPGNGVHLRDQVGRKDQRWWYGLKKKIGDVKPLKYLVDLPQGYNAAAGERWPLMLFLHGSGERGDNLQAVRQHGPPKLAAAGQKFPFIIVSPQCPAGERWVPAQLNDLLDEVMAKYRVDADRVYLTGLSMGGSGTWNLATETPERFAAIAPIASPGNKFAAVDTRELPTWWFIGEKDGDYLELSQPLKAALEKYNATFKLTVYPGAGHVESWENAYSNPSFYEWLLSQRRGHAAQMQIAAASTP
ncbi:MAG TPA: sugar-binding protein [Abditibacteriaceae bacterium]|jgi:predicted peptidase